MNKKTVNIELGDRSYHIDIGNGLLSQLGQNIRDFDFTKNAVIITNPKVGGLYSDKVADSLSKAGFTTFVLEMPDGEEYKNLNTVRDLYDQLTLTPADRKTPVIALGGGVVGDVAGFVAATYRRGLPLIQVPTTLLAQVDSSVGGKTGFDHARGKNLIGAFYQPNYVLIDPDVFKTLEEREYKAGLAEAIKHGIIRDESYFKFFENESESILSLESDAVSRVVYRSCEIKSEIVSADEKESGLRAILNCGHTVAHALETATNYTTFKHGEAVAIGTIVEARIAVDKGWADSSILDRLKNVFAKYGLPTRFPADAAEKSMEAIWQDKKVYSGKLTLVVPEKIGSARIVTGVDPESIRKGIDAESD